MGDRRSRVISFQPSLLTAASTADHLGQCCVMYPATMSRKRNLGIGGDQNEPGLGRMLLTSLCAYQLSLRLQQACKRISFLRRQLDNSVPEQHWHLGKQQ